MIIFAFAFDATPMLMLRFRAAFFFAACLAYATSPRFSRFFAMPFRFDAAELIFAFAATPCTPPLR